MSGVHKPQPGTDLTRRLLYVRYKTCDRNIEDALQSMVPPEVYQPKKHGINGITKATDYIVENDLAVENGFFKYLKESIRDRRTMAAHKYSGGDEGHAHAIEVLEYCWARLIPLRKANSSVATNSKPKSDVDPSASKQKADKKSLCNQFDLLACDHDADADTDDEMDLPQGPRTRPNDSAGTLQASTQSDAVDIALLLFTFEGLMGFAASHFKNLVQISTRIRDEGLAPSVIIAKVMEASVAANIAIQQVAALETMFIEEHPHLNTTYRMYANLICLDHIQNLAKIVAKKSPRASQFSDKDAIAFFGGAIEGVFRNKSRTLVAEFLATWQFIDDKPVQLATGQYSVQSIFTGATMSTAVEVGRADDRTKSILRGQLGLEGSSWCKWEYTGKNRSITNTFLLLQRVSERINQGWCHERGQFGVPCAERRDPATQIKGDMDELLVNDLLPSLIDMCSNGLLAMHDLPYQEELLAGFVQIKSWIKHPERPVSWSLAFTVHVILTGIFDTQECQHALAQAAQFSFLTFNQQLTSVEKRVAVMPRRPPVWGHALEALRSQWLLAHVDIPLTREQILVNVWNPYCAGSLLSHVAYFGNLEMGTALVDSVGQLRMTLHLFNALLQVGALQPGEIQVLDGLLYSFKSCNVIWKGPIPFEGQFKARWRNAVKTSQRLVEVLNLSRSFRRICLLDFTDSDVGGMATNKKRLKKRDPLFKQATSVDETLVAILDESELLATNLVSLSFLLNDLLINLFDALNLMPMVHAMVSGLTEADAAKLFEYRGSTTAAEKAWEATIECKTYECMYATFGDFVLKFLDSGDKSVINVAATVLKNIFKDTKPGTYMWFVPSKEQFSTLES